MMTKDDRISAGSEVRSRPWRDGFCGGPKMWEGYRRDVLNDFVGGL
jgi:hypothetical protein